MNLFAKKIDLYVRLLNEGTEVFRPTSASELGGGLFCLIATPDYDPDLEEWEILPGEMVRIESRQGPKGEFAFAVRP
jgi:hypothetical protein